MNNRHQIIGVWLAVLAALPVWGTEVRPDFYLPENPQENVAYSVAFRTLREAATVLKDPGVLQFALTNCLAGLEQFKMREDRNGVPTRGLLFMEKSWDTAYLWENAEAALACFEAAVELRRNEPAQSRSYELMGLTILRAIAKHHHGTKGFLTEGVDWNNHVGQQHHIGQQKFGDIQYTEPFLNNQHIAKPTLFYLEQLARREYSLGAVIWRDGEGNVIHEKTSSPRTTRTTPLDNAQHCSFCLAWGRSLTCRWVESPTPRGARDPANRQTGGLPHDGLP